MMRDMAMAMQTEHNSVIFVWQHSCDKLYRIHIILTALHSLLTLQ